MDLTGKNITIGITGGRTDKYVCPAYGTSIFMAIPSDNQQL